MQGPEYIHDFRPSAARRDFSSLDVQIARTGSTT
jgi:hypothetical protein